MGAGPHLIPVSHWWAGAWLITPTFENSRILNNIRGQPRVRASIGSTSDVVMIDATAAVLAAAGLNESVLAGDEHVSGVSAIGTGLVYVELSRRGCRGGVVRRSSPARTVMRAGVWLDALAPDCPTPPYYPM